MQELIKQQINQLVLLRSECTGVVADTAATRGDVPSDRQNIDPDV